MRITSWLFISFLWDNHNWSSAEPPSNNSSLARIIFQFSHVFLLYLLIICQKVSVNGVRPLLVTPEKFASLVSYFILKCHCGYRAPEKSETLNIKHTRVVSYTFSTQNCNVCVCRQVLLDLASLIFEEQQCLEVLLRKIAGTIMSFMQAQACTVFIADEDSMVGSLEHFLTKYIHVFITRRNRRWFVPS